MSNFTFENLEKLVGEDLKVVNDQDMDVVLNVHKVYRSKSDNEEFDAFGDPFNWDCLAFA